MPLIERRPLNGLQAPIQAKMSYMLKKKVGKGKEVKAAVAGEGAAANMTKYPMTIEKEKRCRMCKDECVGEDYKKAKDRVSKVKAYCGSCGEPVCPKHRILLCQSCSELFTPQDHTD